MWICLNNAFLSIVHKDCAADELLVRARVEGHIEAVFPDAAVSKTIGNDYLFRAVLPRWKVANAITDLLLTNIYDNFKNSVADDRLHNAYSTVWATMSRLQPIPPYGRVRADYLWPEDDAADLFDEHDD